VEAAPKKFDATAVESKQIDGKNVIDRIELGGTTTSIEFR
jgi:hypothetical protein